MQVYDVHDNFNFRSSHMPEQDTFSFDVDLCELVANEHHIDSLNITNIYFF